MAISQGFQKYFTGFSWQKLRVFPWILFHEKTIKKAMKILLKLHRSWPMKSQKFV